MKIKIVLTLLILLFSVNNVYGEILDEDSFEDSTSSETDVSIIFSGGLGDRVVNRLYVRNSENFQSGLQYMYIDLGSSTFSGTIKGTYDSYYEDIELFDGTTKISDGKIGYYKISGTTNYRVWIWFDLVTWSYTGTGVKNFVISGHHDVYYSMRNQESTYTSSTNVYAVAFGCYQYAQYKYRDGAYTVIAPYSFKNDFYTTYDGMYNIFYDKSVIGYSTDSKIKVVNSLGEILINETSLNSNNCNLSYYDNNIPYILYCENDIGTLFQKSLIFESTIDLSSCRIEVDNIDIGDNIEVSYFNINDLRENPLSYGNSLYETCDLNIQVIADRGYYDELIYQDLIIDETDNTFYYSSDSLTPGSYYAQINRNLGGLTDYAVRSTFIISEPANYSITVNPDTCYVGDKINIIYKSLNMSTLSVYDDNDKLIDNWLNIQGQSQKVYQVPPDYEYNNDYSNWYVMLNDTGNSSNTHRYNFTVNWKVYVEPEPTPEPTESYYNESVEENINELKDGFNPLFELIFGISTIFVDNPDYNKDSVVDVNELSTWINSIVSIAIVIFLFILYKVYKRR